MRLRLLQVSSSTSLHKSPPPSPTLSCLNRLHTLPADLPKLNLLSHPPIYALVFQVVLSLWLSMQNPVHFSLSRACDMPRPLHFSLFDVPNNILGWVQIKKRSGFDPRRGQRIFPLASVSRPALGPTQPPVKWVPGVLSPGVKRGRGVMLTTHPYLVPRS
jgi:hypothetical protein